MREKLEKLPKMYLVGCWARYGVMPFPFSGKFIKDKSIGGNNERVPLVWDYYDGNGTCDFWRLIPITETTAGTIICWTERRAIAKKIANALNITGGFAKNLSTYKKLMGESALKVAEALTKSFSAYKKSMEEEEE